MAGKLFIVILTPVCNGNCLYCGGYDEGLMPPKIQYPLESLKKIVDGNSVAFYGGEPLLEMEKMKEIMDSVKAEHFILQTNGLKLNRLEDEYIRRFSTILVSFDGRREVHDLYRGNYERVLENVLNVRRKGFEGELIARMVASQETDIYEDVMHILNLDCFTHVHWQIDAVWSSDGVWRDFERWVERYNAGVRKLVKFWASELRKGVLHGLVPFMGVATAIFKPFTHPPCSSGFESFAIATDGRILACPICPDLDWNEVGSLDEGIKRRLEILEPCLSCSYFRFCGGRCVFFNRERLWGDRGFRLVCSTVKNLVDSILACKHLILANKEKIMYPRFLNTTEIIP
ncbi:TIGR04084 family radical SAM/SPASM domain-containing protein [Archaeoglobus sp.]|uniref:TIGR04084 family radical SAM/SPASM domain-containing protein n=1 Tax=Archaeoglobus sp. TaxID=1872626 RepID=UPI0024AA8E8C|nr:TIGR04084 family radical SAM/SPASM domain-containing protein [Archaeoglobus sp.]MDI3498032.1 hypothetical protein [Archaeoglobus sp.]